MRAIGERKSMEGTFLIYSYYCVFGRFRPRGVKKHWRRFFVAFLFGRFGARGAQRHYALKQALLRTKSRSETLKKKVFF
jgi:hypothetical protein